MIILFLLDCYVPPLLLLLVQIMLWPESRLLRRWLRTPYTTIREYASGCSHRVVYTLCKVLMSCISLSESISRTETSRHVSHSTQPYSLIDQFRQNRSQIAPVRIPRSQAGKLEPRWRGPYIISGYGGSHKLSYILRQLHGKRIKGTFHGDHLKRLVAIWPQMASLKT